MYRIGIDLGGTFIKAGIVRDNTEIISSLSMPTPESHLPEDTIASIVNIIDEMRNLPEVAGEECEGVGIGSPGTVDVVTGDVLYSNNFGWNNIVCFGREIAGRCGLTVQVANDADVAALGQWIYSGADKSKNTILITIGTGIGSGIVSGGRLYSGLHSGAIEAGHIIVKSGGRKCSCGARGCLESYCSVSSLIKTVNSKVSKAIKKSRDESLESELCQMVLNGKELDGKAIMDCYRKGDVIACKAVNKLMKYLGDGLVSITNVFRPDIIYIGGGFSESFGIMEQYLNDYVATHSFAGSHGYIPKIMKAECGNEAGIYGAAYLAKGTEAI